MVRVLDSRSSGPGLEIATDTCLIQACILWALNLMSQLFALPKPLLCGCDSLKLEFQIKVHLKAQL